MKALKATMVMETKRPIETASLEAWAVRTRLFKVGDELAPFVIDALGSRHLVDGDVLAVTSKIVSLAERALTPRTEPKLDVVMREADQYLGEGGFGVHLTVKHGLLLPSAGIDESNAEGDFYILLPQDPFASAKALWNALRLHYKIHHLGILITDSHTQPLRRGVTGISLAHWGFGATQDLVGKTDLYGRPFRMTSVNAADALSATAVFLMGEGTEPCPLAVLRGARLEFRPETDPNEVRIPLEEDLYRPLFSGANSRAISAGPATAGTSSI